MEIKWEEMDEEPETGFEQQATELQEQAEAATGFPFPEDFEEDE
jgi:hypothetical protein